MIDAIVGLSFAAMAITFAVCGVVMTSAYVRGLIRFLGDMCIEVKAENERLRGWVALEYATEEEKAA